MAYAHPPSAELDIALAWDKAAADLTASFEPAASVAPAQAWQMLTQYLDPAAAFEKCSTNEPCPASVFNAAQALEAAHVQDDLFTWYLDSVHKSFGIVRDLVVAFLDQYEAQEYAQDPQIIARMLHEVGAWHQAWERPVKIFWRSPSSVTSYRQCYLSCLYKSLPPGFSPALTTYLRSLLQSGTLPSTSPSSATPFALSTITTLLDKFDPLLFGLIYEEIEKKVQRDCRGEFESPKLANLGDWLNGTVLAWVSKIYAKTVDGDQEEAKKMLKPTFSRFEYHIHKTLCLLRTTELFDIIVDFPASKPSLDDLKICLYKTDQRTLLVDRLRDLMDRRLLHPGADTKDIISQYISTIRCLRVVDPQGVILSRVADPIRQYLRSREDTIRCIVSSLIEEGNELVAELAASDAKPVQDSKDEAENFNDPKWTPDPIDAPPDFRKSKSSDIIQLLVSIYDSKDVFIKELQVLLAQRMLAIRDYSLDREIKNVEILKIRFGEASLQGCEVMIKDIQDSKRIDNRVHETCSVSPSYHVLVLDLAHSASSPLQIPMHATIVSRLFWPSFQQAPLKLPGQLGRAQTEYDKTFKRLTPGKRLRWLPQLGTVNITVECKGFFVTVDATPVQAAIVELFSQKDEWTLEDLVDELRVTDTSLVKNSLYFWNNHGVVKNVSDDTWKLLEEKEEDAAASHVVEEAVQAVKSVEAQQVEEMRVYWNYISGMLTNLGALPTARIHGTLNMLVATYKGKTTDELEAFLNAMQAEGLVEKGGGGKVWKIVR